MSPKTVLRIVRVQRALRTLVGLLPSKYRPEQESLTASFIDQEVAEA